MLPPWLESCISDSGSLLLNVIDVEPDVNWLGGRKKLGNVSLKEFLEFDREFTDALCAHVIVPLDDIAALAGPGIGFDPLCHRIIISTGGDEFPEGVCGDFREAKEEVVEGAVELVFPKRSGKGGPALIKGASGNDVAPESFAGTAWEISGIGEICAGHFHRVSSGPRLGQGSLFSGEWFRLSGRFGIQPLQESFPALHGPSQVVAGTATDAVML